MFSGIITDIFRINGIGTVIAVQDLDGLPVVGDDFELAGHRCRIVATGKVRTSACLTGEPLTGDGATMFLIEDCGLLPDDIVIAHGLRIRSASCAPALPREE